MSAMVPTPKSQTDPYVPEESNEAPVKLKLIAMDGTVHLRKDGKRVLTVPPVPVRLGERTFLYRATEGDGTRIYRELPALDLDPVTLSPLQTEYVQLTAELKMPAMEQAFYGDRLSVTDGSKAVRRQQIAIYLTEQEISRIQKRKGE